jgi:isopenicillin N synthase-like dioxygenase
MRIPGADQAIGHLIKWSEKDEWAPYRRQVFAEHFELNVGYLPIKGDTLRTSTVESVTKPNLNEALFVARDLPTDHPDVLADLRFRSANQWPSALSGFRDVIVEYCDTMERLMQKLVRLYARALDLPTDISTSHSRSRSTNCE